jgi:hypothetical protein
VQKARNTNKRQKHIEPERIIGSYLKFLFDWHIAIDIMIGTLRPFLKVICYVIGFVFVGRGTVTISALLIL